MYLAEYKYLYKYLEILDTQHTEAAAGAVTNFTLCFRCVNLLESRVYMIFTDH